MSGQDEIAQKSPKQVSAFGAANRDRLIQQYFGSTELIEPAVAWSHVYRLLLWTDQTTGLAHCYESDKSQPGKRWYSRSLAFHDWLAGALGVQPAEVAQSIDWLFMRASEELAMQVLRRAAAVSARAEVQRQGYDERGFPKPGDDPELVAIIREELAGELVAEPKSETWNRLVERVRQYLALENKRKNLVGEGFEDIIAEVVRRTCPNVNLSVHTRRALNLLPGFNRPRSGDKPNKVDVAIVRQSMRTLVTAKWSVRADREKQFITDFADYVTAESDRKPFEYVFVTNEFDPARLMRACDQLSSNSYMFTSVVHINTDALRAAYVAASVDGEGGSIQRVLNHIDTGRLISLDRWLSTLAGTQA